MNVKKTFFTLSFAWCFLTLGAQNARFQAGFQIKSGISDMIYRNSAYPSTKSALDKLAAPRFSTGLTLVGLYRMHTQFYLEGGIGYELSGYRIKDFEVIQTTSDNPEGIFAGTAKGIFNYQHLNISFQGRGKPFKGAEQFYLLLGATGQIFVNPTYTEMIDYQDGTSIKTTQELEGNGGRLLIPFNIRLDLGFGYEFKAFGQSGFFVEPVFGYSLLPMYREYSGSYWQYAAGVNLGILW